MNVAIKNVGNSPARDVTVIFRVSNKPYTLSPDNNLDPIRKHPLANLLGIGIEEKSSFGFLPDDIFDSLGQCVPGNVGMIEAIIGYRTVFDTQRTALDLETAVRFLPVEKTGKSSLTDIFKKIWQSLASCSMAGLPLTKRNMERVTNLIIPQPPWCV